MIKYLNRYLFLAIIVLAGLSACEQSDPPPLPDFGREGELVSFSGFDWIVKGNGQLQGPGPNYFSKREEDIFLDSNGFLHLKIDQQNGVWHSTEVVSVDTMGYGEYTWTVEGDFVSMPENIVVGLFTWDSNTFYSDGNSEVDIEFSKWGNASQNNTLQYGVQPIAFSQFFAERVHKPAGSASIMNGVSTHSFIWTDSLISWKSYEGSTVTEEALRYEWEFDLNNPPRVKEEGGQSSQPIVIPAPGNTTNARINLWILTGINPVISSGIPPELIIRKFNYEAL